MSSVLIITNDSFCVKEGRLWGSPILSSSLRLFGDNFERMGIVARLSLDPPDQAKHVMFPDSCHLHPIPDGRGFWHRAREFASVLGLVHRLRKQYEVLYLRMFTYSALAAGIYCTLLRVPRWFVTLHGDVEEAVEIGSEGSSTAFTGLRKRILGALTRWICKHPTVLFVSGPALGQKYCGGSPNAIPFMDSGITEQDVLRERTDTCQKAPYWVICVGEISKRKGCDVLVAAIARLRKAGHAVALRIVGSGSSREIADQASKLGIADAVELAGYCTYGTPLFNEMRKADILAVPSLGAEGWNRAITEANAQGLPMVVSEVNSLGIGVREWECGLVVPPRDPEKLADAIAFILNNPQERSRMIQRSLERGRFYTYDKEFLRMRKCLEQAFPGGLMPLARINFQQGGR